MTGKLPKNGIGRAKNGTIHGGARSLDDLAVFVCVAQQGSFVAASRRVAIPTSSVSRAVARLEQELGVQLLRRSSRKVAVTDEGRQLLDWTGPHLEGLEEALALTADRRPRPRGVVRVTAPAYTGSTRIARSLAAFSLTHREITIELDATNVMRDLLQDGFDFAVRVGSSVSPDFVARRLWQGQYGLFAAEAFVKNVLSGNARVSRELLERKPCVALRRSACWRFRSPSGSLIEISPQLTFAVNDPRGTAEVARQGVGIALLPLDAVTDDSQGLVRLTTDFGEPEPIDLYLVYPTRRLLPQRVRMAIDWLMKEGKAGEATTRSPRRR
ncbi:MAG TPA: LysR family transcriptional regulator [Polyangiaceae bacterium]|nr:LysR family transcriptional regulator [Polyangiaceae bacterium]